MTETKITKVTKAQRFEDIIALLTGESVKYGTEINDAIVFINHELDLLARKNAPNSKKAEAKREQDNQYKELIKAFLSEQTEGVTATQILKGIPEFDAITSQKVARLTKEMVEANTITKAVVKGRSLFSIG